MGLAANGRLGLARARVAESALLRDCDIRHALSVWLAQEHRGDPSTVVYEEFAIPRPTARADLAVVNGSLVGYEIKSDVDSLARLAAQARSYSHVFDRVFLVTTTRRADVYAQKVPDWWGILKTRNDGSVTCVRRGRLNKAVSPEHALHLLRRSELDQIARKLDLKIPRKLTKSQVVIFLTKNMRRNVILFEMREQLKERKRSMLYMSSSNDG